MLLGSHSIYLFQFINNLVPVTSPQPQWKAPPRSLILDIPQLMHSMGGHHAYVYMYTPYIHTHIFKGIHRGTCWVTLGNRNSEELSQYQMQGLP